MSEILKKIKSKLVLTNNIVFFVACFVVAVYFLPKEKSFQSEYSNNKPWLHETLFSPFNFPVKKSSEELAIEQLNIRQAAKPIFQYQPSVSEEVLRTINNLEIDPGIKSDLLTTVAELYDSYVFDVFQLSSIENKEGLLVLNKNNLAESLHKDSVFTMKTAYQFLKTQLVMPDKYVASLDLSQFVKANCLLDEEKTQLVLDNSLSVLSENKGIVAKGEKIVDRGEIVTPSIYNKLVSLTEAYASYYSTNETQVLTQLISNSILLAVLFVILFVYLYAYERVIFNSMSKVVFILMQVLIVLILVHFFKRYEVNFYILPVVSVPLLSTIFLNKRVGIALYMMILLMLGIYVPNPYEFLFVQLVAGVVAIKTISNMFQRSQFFISILYVILSYVLMFSCFDLMRTGDLMKIDYTSFTYFLLNALLLIFLYPLLYIVEKSFGFLSSISLVELSDANQPLLRQLAERAPGTFQHSMQVANLAQEASYAIGTNSLLVRCGALYHDIGKIQNPNMFIENQGGDPNMHDKLDPRKSAAIILGHVTEGVEMAKKRKVPRQIVEFIASHHGDRVLYHFKQKYEELNPEEEVDENLFRYKGTRPSTRETALVMMADSVEAASRSIKKIDADKISALVNNIIDKQIAEGQIESVDITFKEIQTVKNVFIKKLKEIYHERIEYPEQR